MKRLLALPLLLAAAACSSMGQSTGPAASASAMPTIACAAPLRAAIEHQVYFGRARGARGEVTEAEWLRFMSEVVTPRFPDGLSVMEVAGQSRASTSNRTLRERTKLLIVVVPVPPPGQRDGRIDDVAESYRTRFAQRAVFRVDRPVCASL